MSAPQPPSPPIVEFREVTKRFGDGPLVLDGLNLTTRPGEFVSLIGPSGCGKSTLLRLIAGLTPVTTGALTVDGRSPDAAAADLAFVFQEPTLLPWLTVGANIELPLSLRGVAGEHRLASAAKRRAPVNLRRPNERSPASMLPNRS